jgi:hypothetical protein
MSSLTPVFLEPQSWRLIADPKPQRNPERRKVVFNRTKNYVQQNILEWGIS